MSRVGFGYGSGSVRVVVDQERFGRAPMGGPGVDETRVAARPGTRWDVTGRSVYVRLAERVYNSVYNGLNWSKLDRR